MIPLLSLLACDPKGEEDLLEVSIPFTATVAGEDFACGTTYPGLGTTGVTIDPQDLRLYVYDVALIDASGEAVAVALDQDRTWQYQNLALLDFEDGTGACATGSPDTHTAVTGTVPRGDYQGLTFMVGVPTAFNHLDAATAPAPLNDPGLWWAWTSGFKYARIDVGTGNNPAFYFHLGATDCAQAEDGSYSCTLDNLPAVTLADFVLDADAVNIDLARLYAGNDLEAPVDYVTDFVSGCMAFAGDPECEAMLGTLGLPWGDATVAPEQTLFALEAL